MNPGRLGLLVFVCAAAGGVGAARAEISTGDAVDAVVHRFCWDHQPSQAAPHFVDAPAYGRQVQLRLWRRGDQAAVWAEGLFRLYSTDGYSSILKTDTRVFYSQPKPTDPIVKPSQAWGSHFALARNGDGTAVRETSGALDARGEPASSLVADLKRQVLREDYQTIELRLPTEAGCKDMAGSR